MPKAASHFTCRGLIIVTVTVFRSSLTADYGVDIRHQHSVFGGGSAHPSRYALPSAGIAAEANTEGRDTLKSGTAREEADDLRS